MRGRKEAGGGGAGGGVRARVGGGAPGRGAAARVEEGARARARGGLGPRRLGGGSSGPPARRIVPRPRDEEIAF